MSLSHPTRLNYTKLGALAARSRGTDESMPLPPLIKPAQNTSAAASNHVSRSTWKAAGCHSPQTPCRLICVMSASSVGEKGANYVDRVSNWMRWQKEREESGSSEVNQGTSHWSIAFILASPDPKKQAGGQRIDCLSLKNACTETLHLTTGAFTSKNTHWVTNSQSQMVLNSSPFMRFFSKKKTKNICSLGSLCFPSLTMEGRAMMMVEHCDPILLYLSWQLHAQHSPWECSWGCCH